LLSNDTQPCGTDAFVCQPFSSRPIAPWELRAGRLRVYDEVREEPEPAVLALAVGVKDRNVVRIGGEEIVL
jgi:hypothetical protein